jgi:hypothetical protein
VKVVQQVLGYKSATMTLDRYGHLFGDRLDVVADGIDAPRVGPYCPSVADTVVDLAAERQMATAQIVPGYVVGGDEGTRTPNPRLAKARHRTVADVNERGPPYFVRHSTVGLREPAGSFRERFVYPMCTRRDQQLRRPSRVVEHDDWALTEPLPETRRATHAYPTTTTTTTETPDDLG